MNSIEREFEVVSKSLIDAVDMRFGLHEAKLNEAQTRVKPCRVKYKGIFISNNKGKTVWKHPSHAKNAIRCLLEHEIDKCFSWLAYETWQFGRIAITDEERTALEKKLWEKIFSYIEIVPVSAEDLVKQRKT